MKKIDKNVALFTSRCVKELKANREYSTAAHYESTLRSVLSFKQGGELYFSNITRKFIYEYNSYLAEKGLQWNTISFYNRVLRAICNKAYKKGLKISVDAFEGAYTKVAGTKKRAVSAGIIIKLMKLEFGERKDLEFARDMFLFSFATQGMTFVDIAYLRPQDVTGDIIRYRRKKTGQSIEVVIEPIAREIISKYGNYHRNYLFPILSGNSIERLYKQYRSKLTLYNHNLKIIGRMAGLRKELTSYVSRHSWATAALKNHVPVSVISQALGHSSERTTLIYLSRLQTSEVARANRKILGNLYRVNTGLH